MKRLIGFFALSALLASCASNLVIGTPTVQLSAGNSSVGKPDPTTGLIDYTFEVKASTLPGSGGGVIGNLNLSGGGTLGFSQSVPSCPVSSTQNCGPVTIKYSGSATSHPPVTVVSYVAMGDNGIATTISLPVPLTVFGGF